MKKGKALVQSPREQVLHFNSAFPFDENFSECYYVKFI